MQSAHGPARGNQVLKEKVAVLGNEKYIGPQSSKTNLYHKLNVVMVWESSSNLSLLSHPSLIPPADGKDPGDV